MAIAEFAVQQAAGYDGHSAKAVANREFKTGEFAPGGGWKVLVAQKPASS